MYGLLLEAISDYIKTEYGEEKWEEICSLAGVGPNCFSTHEIYGEEIIPNVARAAGQILETKTDEIMDNFGVAFVSFVGQYGYDNILKVLGRNLRDFLNGLDNLHEYLRFSYPKLKPPSFFVENESRAGLTLHYRSRRRGFLHYVKGQIRRVGELFYNTKINIYVVDETENPEDGTTHVKFRLLFDNEAFRDINRPTADGIVDNIPLRSELLFELFPFHLVFGRKLEIRSAGSALVAVIPDIVGKDMSDVFFLTRPMSKLRWEELVLKVPALVTMADSQHRPETVFTAARVEQAVVQMYSQTCPGSQVLAFLTQAQSSPAAWHFSWELLQPEKPPEVQFFGASCLHAKARNHWTQLHLKDSEQLTELLKRKLVQLSAAAKFVVSKLHQVVATVALRQKVAVNPMQYVFSLHDTSDVSRVYDTYLSILNILSLLPEESVCGCPPTVNYDETDLGQGLMSQLPEIMNWLTDLLAAKLPDRCLKHVFRCVRNWVNDRTEAELLLPILEHVLLALQSAQTFHEAVEAGEKVLACRSVQNHPHMLSRVLRHLPMLKQMVDSALYENDTDILDGLCSIMVAASENNIDILLSMLLKGEPERGTALALLENIMNVGFPLGQYPQSKVNPTSLEFWSVLASGIGYQYSSNQENWMEALEMLKDVYKRLFMILLEKVHYPDDCQWEEWDTDERLQFESVHREQICETLGSCFDVLQEPMVQFLCETLQTVPEKVEKGNHVKWQEVEAILVILTSIGEKIRPSDSTYMPAVMKCLPSVHFGNSTVLNTSLSLISQFKEWLLRHADIIHTVFPVVLQGLRHRVSAENANEILWHFYEYAFNSIHPFIQHIVSVTQEILMKETLDKELRRDQMLYVGHVLSTLPTKEVYINLQLLLAPELQLLQHLLGQKLTYTVESQLSFHMDLLACLLSCFNTTRGGYRQERESKGVNLQGDIIVREVLQTFLPVIKELVNKMKTSPAVVEAVCQMFTKSLIVLGKDCYPMADSLTAIIVEMYEATPHESILWFANKVVIWLEHDSRFSEHIINSISRKTLQSFDQLNDAYLVLSAFNYFMANVLSRSQIKELATGVNLEEALHTGVKTLKSAWRSVVEAGCVFIKKLLLVSLEEDRYKAAVCNNMHFIVNTVMGEICCNPQMDVPENIAIGITDHPEMSLLEVLANLLWTCYRYYLESFTVALRHCLSQVLLNIQASDQDKTNFFESFIQNAKNLNNCRSLVLKFAQACRGISRKSRKRSLVFQTPAFAIQK